MASDPGLSLPDRITQLKNLSHALTGLKLIHEAEATFDEGIAIEDRLLRGWLRQGGLARRARPQERGGRDL
ncbi:MAG: hypothetical protein ACR2I7_05265 [Geodermatophilaceae bacterium]